MDSNTALEVLTVAKSLGLEGSQEALTFISWARSKMPEGEASQVELQVDHKFTTGLYSRALHIPAGCFLAGRVHLFQHQFCIAAGEISIWTQEGGVQHLVAPVVGITSPGMFRLGYAHTDCLFVTFHPEPSNEPDPDKLKAELTVVPLNFLQKPSHD